MHSEESFAREVDVDVTSAAGRRPATPSGSRVRTTCARRPSPSWRRSTSTPSSTRAPTRRPTRSATSRTASSRRWSEQTGFPAIGVPMGYGTVAGLPASIEFLGRRFGEAELIEIAAGYEAASRRRAAAGEHARDDRPVRADDAGRRRANRPRRQPRLRPAERRRRESRADAAAARRARRGDRRRRPSRDRPRHAQPPRALWVAVEIEVAERSRRARRRPSAAAAAASC